MRVKLRQKRISQKTRQKKPDGCRISRLGQTFLIHAVNLDDSGIYYCEAPPQVKIRPKEEAFLTINPGKLEMGHMLV